MAGLHVYVAGSSRFVPMEASTEPLTFLLPKLTGVRAPAKADTTPGSPLSLRVRCDDSRSPWPGTLPS